MIQIIARFRATNFPAWKVTYKKTGKTFILPDPPVPAISVVIQMGLYNWGQLQWSALDRGT